MSFYPNECSVCKSTTNLKRCSSCNMISYCGELHQKNHWNNHQEICKILSSIKKQKGISHPYENLQGVDNTRWKHERESLLLLVSFKIKRPLTIDEIQMLQFPRACFVCHDARQNLLKNCPNCPLISFCKDHPSSSLHEKDCRKIKAAYDLETRPYSSEEMVSIIVKSMAISTRFYHEFLKPPTSMEEYLNQTISIPGHSERAITSEHVGFPLTIFNAFQKLKYFPPSEVVLHVGGSGKIFAFSNSWEILLHLFPKINSLTIMFFELSETTTTEPRLCDKCISRRNKLTIVTLNVVFMQYVRERNYRKPNLIAMFDVNPPDKFGDQAMIWQMHLESWSKITCPLLLTTIKEKDHKFLTESLRTTPWHSLICYNGINKFAPLLPIRDWEEGGVNNPCQFLIVAKGSSGQYKNQTLSRVIKEIRFDGNSSEEKNWRNIFFFTSLCHVCHSSYKLLTCKRCKMIFYCGEGHQKEDYPRHKDLCKVILKMLNESGSPNLFDKLKTDDSELWLKAKIDLMKKSKAKLGRELLEYERKMFLFPKTCFACHESDLSLLRNCACGVSLCKTHRDDSRHKNICNDLNLALKLEIMGELPRTLTLVHMVTNNLPGSMKKFIDSCLKFKDGTSRLNIPNFQDIAISEHITRPLTFLYAMKKLNFCAPNIMVLHVIGIITKEIEDEGYWQILSYWLRNLKHFMLVFIGLEISDCTQCENPFSFFDKTSLDNKSSSFKAYRARYEDYVRSGFFVKPDFVIGYNLNISESQLGISECTWKDTILALKEINVPFLITAGSKKRAIMDHNGICKILGKSVNYAFCEENPYSSLVPERDFLTEGVMYSNKYVTLYKEFDSKETLKKSRRNDGERENLIRVDLKSQTGATENVEVEKKFKIESSKSDSDTGRDNKEIETEGSENLEVEMKLQTESFAIEKETGIKHKESADSGRGNKEIETEGSVNLEVETKLQTESFEIEKETGIKNKENENKPVSIANSNFQSKTEEKKIESNPAGFKKSKCEFVPEVQNKKMELVGENPKYDINLKTEKESGEENKEIENKSISIANSNFPSKTEKKKIESDPAGFERSECKFVPEVENKKMELLGENPKCDINLKTEKESGEENEEIENKLANIVSPNFYTETEKEKADSKPSGFESFKCKFVPEIENNKIDAISKIDSETVEMKTSRAESSETKSMNSKESKRESDKVENKGNLNFQAEPSPINEELLKENFLLKQGNKMLKEILLLKEKNEQLKLENVKLNQENESLKEKNRLIKDIRKEVQETIVLAMNKKL